ncbi:MAG TPA: EamA family transporter [Terracidiphilus sp.]|jgi:drug/metabolite transporter (DMT)-like permease|nr:EamA family transporter [Terracidiphilus sp.]
MTDRPLGKILLAYGIVYFVWGSTFLAIRVGVREAPPFLYAGMRFVVAGALLYAWTRWRGERGPSGREWMSIALVALLIFVGDYGLLFWVETWAPSGITAVMMATIPAFMAIAEVVLLRKRRFTVGLGAALAVGLAGVAVLTLRSASLGSAAISGVGAAVLVFAAINWSVASVLTRKLPLPQSKMISSGAQMLVGGVMLGIVAGALGEFPRFHPAAVSMGAWVALAYLIVAGSIMGFTAYLWLIHHESPTRVGTYAYVNPVVAVLIGHWFGGEELGVRAVAGAALILASVVAIIATRAKSGS